MVYHLGTPATLLQSLGTYSTCNPWAPCTVSSPPADLQTNRRKFTTIEDCPRPADPPHNQDVTLVCEGNLHKDGLRQPSLIWGEDRPDSCPQNVVTESPVLD